MTGKYRFADKIFEIESCFSMVQDFCKDYTTTGESDFVVRTGLEEIDYERVKAREEANREGIAGEYSDAYLETLAVYRKVAECLVFEDTILFHGSVVAVDGEGYLFAAKSGTGKSTHTRLWRDVFGDRAVMINDDKPLLKFCDKRIVAYGTPWNGKHHLGCNMSVPLKAICLLERGEKNHITKVDGRDRYAVLLQQCYRPKNPAMLKHTLKLLDDMVQDVPLYCLQCNMEEDAAMVAYRGMQ